MLLRQDRNVERELLERMTAEQSPFVIIRFHDGDLIVIRESPYILDHSVGFLQLDRGVVVPCICVQSSQYKLLTNGEIVDAKDCSDGLSDLINLADLYLGMQHEFK